MRPQEPLLSDPRSYESEDGDVLPVDAITNPVTPRPDRTEYMMKQVDDSEVVSPTTRALQKALAGQAIDEKFEVTDAYVDAHLASIPNQFNGMPMTPEKRTLKDENLDVREALLLIHKEAGFYARNNEEKNAMQGIMAKSDSGFPVKHYLDVIEYHQRDANTDDPVRALRSITADFERYAVQADREARFTRKFTQSLADFPVNMNQKLSQNVSADDLLGDEATKRTLVSLARLREVDLFIEGKGENPLGVKAGIDTLKGKELNERIFELLDAMQLSALMRLNDRLYKEENNRFGYWKKQLQGARMHPAIRAQVDASLAKLDKLRPAHS